MNIVIWTVHLIVIVDNRSTNMLSFGSIRFTKQNLCDTKIRSKFRNSLLTVNKLWDNLFGLHISTYRFSDADLSLICLAFACTFVNTERDDLFAHKSYHLSILRYLHRANLTLARNKITLFDYAMAAAPRESWSQASIGEFLIRLAKRTCKCLQNG